MDACLGVEREVDKVLSKFDGIKGHAEKTLEELTESMRSVKEELEHGKYIQYFEGETVEFETTVCRESRHKNKYSLDYI